MSPRTTICILVMLTSRAYAQHDHGSVQGNPSAHGKKEAAAHSHHAAAEFQTQLRAVFTASLQLKEAFVASDAARATAAVPEMRNVLSKVEMGVLKDEALMDWMGYLKVFNDNLDIIASSSDLAAQRKSFGLIHEALYKSLKSFGFGRGVIYYDYCPMANNKTGAYWLSNDKEIRNPYFGNEMLTCGKVKETLQQ